MEFTSQRFPQGGFLHILLLWFFNSFEATENQNSEDVLQTVGIVNSSSVVRVCQILFQICQPIIWLQGGKYYYQISLTTSCWIRVNKRIEIYLMDLLFREF